jgi:vacuolar-type H+-ATPase catalytic subunit A/Vma1
MQFIEGYFNLINNHVKNGSKDQSFFNKTFNSLEKALNSEREFSENQFSMYEKKYNESSKKCKESEYGIVRFYRKSMKSYRQRLKEIENYFDRLEKVKQSIVS